MQRTSTVTAMVRSACGVILLTGIVLLLPVANTAAYALEREATVELLPNDLVSEDREQESANQAIIATPKQVIEHQVLNTWRTMLRKMLDETRTGMKQKRTLPDVNQYNGMVYLIKVFIALINLGMIPQLSNPAGGLGAAPPVPVSSITSGSMVPNFDTGTPLNSLPGGGGIPDTSLVHSVPGTITGGALVPEYAGGGLIPGTGVLSGGMPVPVDTGHVTGVVDSPPAALPLPTHNQVVPDYAGGGLVAGAGVLSGGMPVDTGHVTGVVDSSPSALPVPTHNVAPKDLSGGVPSIGSYGL
uniref:Uncharacterized protein n=1 Tax=Anopheles maculatus TaxID=74869 RepID=A0A182SAE3_9DIPT